VHDFTARVGKMKQWLDASRAEGGGDAPEAVADALHDVSTQQSPFSIENTPFLVNHQLCSTFCSVIRQLNNFHLFVRLNQ
jgi:hypothetical protein